jgi:hypothetical protein
MQADYNPFLLEELLDMQRGRDDELTRFEDALRARRQAMGGHRAGNQQLASIERLLWLADDGRSCHWDYMELDAQPVFDRLERLCVAILTDVAQPEPEPDDGDDFEPEPVDHRQLRVDDHHVPGVIRPTGRAPRARQPYMISTAVRETNFFAKSLEFDDRNFRLIYRLVQKIF